MMVQALEADGADFDSLLPPPATCVASGKLCHLLEPQFPRR